MYRSNISVCNGEDVKVEANKSTYFNGFI